jgi:hypothetical protein
MTSAYYSIRTFAEELAVREVQVRASSAHPKESKPGESNSLPKGT